MTKITQAQSDEALKRYGPKWWVDKSPLEIYYMTHPEVQNVSFEEYRRKWEETMSKSIFEQNEKAAQNPDGDKEDGGMWR